MPTKTDKVVKIPQDAYNLLVVMAKAWKISVRKLLRHLILEKAKESGIIRFVEGEEAAIETTRSIGQTATEVAGSRGEGMSVTRTDVGITGDTTTVVSAMIYIAAALAECIDAIVTTYPDLRVEVGPKLTQVWARMDEVAQAYGLTAEQQGEEESETTT